MATRHCDRLGDRQPHHAANGHPHARLKVALNALSQRCQCSKGRTQLRVGCRIDAVFLERSPHLGARELAPFGISNGAYSGRADRMWDVIAFFRFGTHRNFRERRRGWRGEERSSSALPDQTGRRAPRNSGESAAAEELLHFVGRSWFASGRIPVRCDEQMRSCLRREHHRWLPGG